MTAACTQACVSGRRNCSAGCCACDRNGNVISGSPVSVLTCPQGQIAAPEGWYCTPVSGAPIPVPTPVPTPVPVMGPSPSPSAETPSWILWAVLGGGLFIIIVVLFILLRKPPPAMNMGATPP